MAAETKDCDVKELEKIYEKKYKDLVLDLNNTIENKFENLVFSGGGAKCIAQVGALKVLEKVGILNKITRFAGTSGGALTAAFAALGYSPDRIETILKEDNLDDLVKGQSWWRRSLNWIKIPFNAVFGYGVYTAHPFESWLEKRISEAPHSMGNGSITFKELYTFDNRHIELAITATDISRGYCAFFHPKTHPDIPIKEVLRMTISIPAYFTPVELSNVDKAYDDKVGVFVDGGVLFNYPVMCFDGWFLSMTKPDVFVKRYFSSDDIDRHFSLDVLKDTRFIPDDDFDENKTIGVMVYSGYDDDSLKTKLKKRKLDITDEHGKDISIKQKRPKTVLQRKRGEEVDKLETDGKALLRKAHIMKKWVKFVNSFIQVKDLFEDGISLADTQSLIKIVSSIEPDRSTLMTMFPKLETIIRDRQLEENIPETANGLIRTIIDLFNIRSPEDTETTNEAEEVIWCSVKRKYPALFTVIKESEHQRKLLATNPQVFELIIDFFNSVNKGPAITLNILDANGDMKTARNILEFWLGLDIPTKDEFHELFGSKEKDKAITEEPPNSFNLRAGFSYVFRLLTAGLLRTQEESGDLRGSNKNDSNNDGQDITAERIFQEVGVDTKDKIHIHHLNKYAYDNNFQFMKQFPSTIPPTKPTNYKEYIQLFLNTVMNTVELAHFKPHDIRRSIGINTDYLRTFDFGMDKLDKDFLIHQGMIATLTFLDEYVTCKRRDPGP